MLFFIIFFIVIILFLLFFSIANQYPEIDYKDFEFEKRWKPKYKKSYREQTNKEKGDEYEFYIGRLFKEHGYKVYYKGINEGYFDEGIDLICYKDLEVVLIQCKNWKKQADLNSIKKFVYNCREYEQKNHIKLKRKRIRKIFVISNPYKNKEIREYLKQINNEIEFFNVALQKKNKYYF
nr:restriction endonuclease [uncultured Campylobacter sp.]